MTDKLHFDDLTKITCPPGMLDADTLLRLESWPHGFELWNGQDWTDTHISYCGEARTIRAKPAPGKQVGWINVYPYRLGPGHDSREEADVWAGESRVAVYRIEWDETGHVEWFREEL